MNSWESSVTKAGSWFLLLSVLAMAMFSSHAQSWSETAAVELADAEDRDQFGVGVAIDGDLAIVGAWLVDDNTSSGAKTGDEGAAYIYERINGVWALKDKLVASDRHANQGFGNYVAIAGNVALVGATAGTTHGIGNAGAAYFFEDDGSGWKEVQKVSSPMLEPDGRFGSAVALSNKGDRAIIGAPRETVCDGIERAGAAYTYTRNSSGHWQLVQRIHADDPAFDAQFGLSVGIAGNTWVVGSPYSFTGPGNSRAGAVYVFKQDGILTQTQKLVANSIPNAASFGRSLDLTTNIMVIGSPGDNTGGSNLQGAGAAYIFRRNGSNWQQSQKLTIQSRPREYRDFYGFSVAIDRLGETVAVGVPGDSYDAIESDSNKRHRSGAAYIYSLNQNNSVFTQKLVASDRNNNYVFGYDVAISSNPSADSSILVGAYLKAKQLPHLNATGGVYFFDQ